MTFETIPKEDESALEDSLVTRDRLAVEDSLVVRADDGEHTSERR